MTSRKEDEKNERVIRSLLKQPDNKKCINCNSLGPQYVCTNFWTFVCTTCSGIHREFTHRVKSVSMAKFTSQEVAALQNGGNEHARQIYFKEWDSQRHSHPNNSNVERLRDFIRHVYVDRRFSVVKSVEKPPRGDDSYEHMSDKILGGSRSPPYEDTYCHRRNDRPSPGARSDDSYSKYDDRSPGHDKESRYSSDHGRSPSRPEIVNDWHQGDRFSNSRRPEDNKMSDGDSLSEGRSPDHQKDINMPSPAVRPVREILRDSVITPKIDPPKPNGISVADAPVHVVRTASSSSFGSSDGNQVQTKRETLGSLIDFDADSVPPAVSASVSHTEPTSLFLTTTQPTSSTGNDNWASFDFSTNSKAPEVQASSANALNSLFEQLTSSSSLAPARTGHTHNFSNPMFASSGVSNAPVGTVAPPPFSAEGFASVPVRAVGTVNNTNVSGSWPGMQHQQQPQSFPIGVSDIFGSQQPFSFPAAQVPLSVPRTAPHEVSNGFEAQSQKAETMSNGRNALPEDLFASTYHPSVAVPQGWHTSNPAGVGFAMHYTPTHNFQQTSKSANPFDLGDESSAAQAPMFPSMAALHGAIPTNPLQTAGLTYFSNVAAPPAYMQHQDLSYNAGMPSGANYGQQAPQSTRAIRPQGVSGVVNSSFFASADQNQFMPRGYAAQNQLPSAGGNPFG